MFSLDLGEKILKLLAPNDLRRDVLSESWMHASSVDVSDHHEEKCEAELAEESQDQRCKAECDSYPESDVVSLLAHVRLLRSS